MRRALVLSMPILLLVPATAHAHLMTTGLGPFYDGVAHLFVSPDDLIAVIALALLGGLRGPQNGRTVLLLLPVTWLLANVVGRWIAAPPAHETAWAALSAAATFAIGALIAADIWLPGAVVSGSVIGLGLLHGALNGVEAVGQGSWDLVPVGIAVALFVVVSLIAGQATTIRRDTTARIVARVAGSWIAAVGLLMFGWSMRA
jgi:urease accessory protein